MILVVNMIPNDRSGETNQDSEPNIAVNPANPLQIVGTAFTPDPMGGSNAPIYVSSDGGQTWLLNSIVPSAAGSRTGTFDITPRFSAVTNNLYAGILRAPSANLQILRTSNFLSPTTMTILVDRADEDQPFVQAATFTDGSGVRRDRVYVGHNDFNASPQTATIEQALDAATAPPVPPPPPSGFTSDRLETRDTSGQDGPQIRPAVHPDGTIYGIFYRWRTFNGSIATADVVVVREDNWGTGATPFNNLIDPDDQHRGIRVAQKRAVPWAMPGLGQERIGGDLSIAVDPQNSSTVYIAWAERVATDDYTLHVQRSTDRGATWSAYLRTITNAKNPALAINSRGSVGFLYRQLTGTAPNQRWETHLERTSNAFTTFTDLLLATMPGDVPTRTFFPYLGDYDHLMAVGKDFYGVFSANNTPDMANFPLGVVYQRNANFATHTLLNKDNVTPVAVSIDPFFFKLKVTEDAHVVSLASNGRLWHTIRFVDGTWQSSFGDVNAQESNNPGPFTAVSCAGAGDDLHVVSLASNGRLWHTIRFVNGTWQSAFGDVNAQESNNPGPFRAVGCAGVGSNLHVVSLTGDGKLWHTIRFTNGAWQSFFGDVNAQESNNPGPFTVVGCAGVGSNLHVVSLTGDGKLWHTIRFADGSWQPFFGDVNAQESNDPGPFTAISCAGIGGNLHVVSLTGDGKLWHTIRFANGTWQSAFGDVNAQEANDPGPFAAVSCAGVGDDLHVIGLAGNGRLWHTIRFVDGTWQPVFGDVNAQEANNPGPFIAASVGGV